MFSPIGQFLRTPSDDMYVGEGSGRTRVACSTRNRKSQDPLKEGVVILTEPLLMRGFQTKDQDLQSPIPSEQPTKLLLILTHCKTSVTPSGFSCGFFQEWLKLTSNYYSMQLLPTVGSGPNPSDIYTRNGAIKDRVIGLLAPTLFHLQ